MNLSYTTEITLKLTQTKTTSPLDAERIYSIPLTGATLIQELQH